MQFLSTIALFSGATLAAKYAAGTVCHTNVECNKNCVESKWTIAHSDDDDYYFVCDAKTMDPTQYYTATCGNIVLGASGAVPQVDSSKTGKACAKVGGLVCGSGCVVTAKRSDDGDARASWNVACGPGEWVSNNFVQYKSEADAKVVAGCGSS